MSEDGPAWRTPSNQEWADGKAWARAFKADPRLAKLAQQEWIEGVRRRLGLVAEVHRCGVFDDDDAGDGWAWICLRGGCSEGGYRYLSQPDAFADAFAHARLFLPEPPEETPVTELDLLAFDALWAGMRSEQEAFAAALPGRTAEVAEQVNEYLSGLLPQGMRFEWLADGE